MNNSLLRQCLDRVALVSKGWAEDAGISAPLRHMSLHVHDLASELGRRKQLCPTSVRNVEVRFCLMCRRLGVEADETCRQNLEHCALLRDDRLATRALAGVPGVLLAAGEALGNS